MEWKKNIKQLVWVSFRIPNSVPQFRLSTTVKKNLFENIVGKGENAGNQHFLLFPQCFLSFPNHGFCVAQW